jgi:hypothetical protein
MFATFATWYRDDSPDQLGPSAAGRLLVALKKSRSVETLSRD